MDTLNDTLNKIIARAKCGITIQINPHRDYYQTAEEWINENNVGKLPNEFLHKKMIELNQVVMVTVYPDTPIGSYDVIHYDLEMALDKMWGNIKHQDENTKP